MNARSIRKKLLRGREHNFWGRRAYITARVEPAAFPEPFPGLPKGLEPGYFTDGYLIPGEDTSVGFFGVYSGSPPTSEEPVYRLTEERTGAWTWREITVSKLDEEGLPTGERLPTEPRHEAWLEEHIAAQSWIWRHVHEPPDHPRFHKLSEATWWAKTSAFNTCPDTGDYCITFGVKWFYPHTSRRFCAALSRWVKALKREGYRVKVRPG